jgi:transposase InsO family protein
MIEFIAYTQTQFSTTPKSFQADNGTEFVNRATTSFLASHGITLRLSCPYTSPQNGKAECMLRTLVLKASPRRPGARKIQGVPVT